ncbi:MAG: tetratricopeptide repeat protein [Candidatus Solibacter usitatus]|nr:tetratricopeptide repeat protein [Candidatus Solibacter usitatus]
MLKASAQQEYSRQDVLRMLAISPQQLRGWQRLGLVREAARFTFSDLIALKALQKLRENRIPPKQIGRALVSLKQKLSHVEHPLSELKISCDGRTIAVQVAGQRMEAISGQMLFDFDTAEIDNLKTFSVPAKGLTADAEREAEQWFQRGLDLEEGGAPMAAAIEAYDKAIHLNPNAAGALVNLGTIHYHLRKFPEAQRYYEQAIAVDPRYALAHFNLGNLCDEWGRLEEATEHYTTALKLHPNYGDAHYNMALLCERLGDYLGATRHWKAYLKVDPASSWSAIAKRQLEKLRQTVVHRGPNG